MASSPWRAREARLRQSSLAPHCRLPWGGLTAQKTPQEPGRHPTCAIHPVAPSATRIGDSWARVRLLVSYPGLSASLWISQAWGTGCQGTKQPSCGRHRPVPTTDGRLAMGTDGALCHMRPRRGALSYSPRQTVTAAGPETAVRFCLGGPPCRARGPSRSPRPPPMRHLRW